MKDRETVENSDAKQYITTDFDLAAYLLMLRGSDGKPVARLLGVKPYQRSQDPSRFQRLLFVLSGSSGEEERTVTLLHAEELRYANKLTAVEPVEYMAQRRQLRTILDRERMTKRGGNRG